MNIKFHENTYVWKCPYINRIILIAEDTTNGKDVGSVVAEKYTDHIPLIYGLNVAQDARRKGVASALLSAAEAWCSEQGYHEVRLYYSPQESPNWVREWYEKRGYVIQRREMHCATYTEYELRKKL